MSWRWGYQCEDCNKVFSPENFFNMWVCPKCGAQLQMYKNKEMYLKSAKRVRYKTSFFGKVTVRDFEHYA